MCNSIILNITEILKEIFDYKEKLCLIQLHFTLFFKKLKKSKS